jgi:hypothetical protein
MNIIYSTSTSEFIPLSYEGNYLYENYSRVTAFLRSKLTSDEIGHISKPKVDIGKVEWYSAQNGPMKPLVTFDDVHQRSVESAYVELLKKIKNEISILRFAKGEESHLWADLLDAVFKVEDNFLVSNGSEWAIIWGWKFHSHLRYASPDFEVSNIITPDISESSAVESSTPIEEKSENNFSNDQPLIEPATPPYLQEPIVGVRNIDSRRRVRVSFWTRLKRILRWLAYRFWAILFILFFMLLCCLLCRQCNNRDGHVFWKEKIIELEEKVDNKCNTSDTLK